MDNMFNLKKRYLILGEKNTNKSELGRNLINNIYENNYLIVDLFNEEFDLEPIASNKIKQAVLLDNYSTKDNRNKSIKKLLNNKNKGVVIVSPYVLATDQIVRMSFDYIFVSKIKDNYTLQLIYTNFIKKTGITFEKFKKLNSCVSYFLLIDNNSLNFGYYDPRKNIFTKIKDFIQLKMNI